MSFTARVTPPRYPLGQALHAAAALALAYYLLRRRDA